MTISKRLRFEILRRDQFRCTYCGVTPAEAELHVDHVIPVSLGGQDIPENLTTSCADCNSGKASTSPNEELIAQVNLAVAAEAAIRARVAMHASDRMEKFDDFENEIIEMWEGYVPSFRRNYAQYPSPTTVQDWLSASVPLVLIDKAMRIAVNASHVPWNSRFDYAAGVVRNDMQRFRKEVEDAERANNLT